MADSDDIPRQELERVARDLGLQAWIPEHMAEFERAYRYAQKMLQDLPGPPEFSDEPAHVFHAGDEA